ncbi:MAG TPA: DUF47 family protein [Nitrososphaerales archaeon]
MFTGESEVQARRKTLSILQDETRRVFDSARDLSTAYSQLLAGKKTDLQNTYAKIRKAEDDAESYRRALTRELAEVGTLMMNREDILRGAYNIEEIAGFVNGIAFRLSLIEPKVLKKGKILDDFKDLLDMAVESVQRLMEMVRALSINPASAIETANIIQKLERQVDDKYRVVINSLMKLDSFKDILMLKDIVERVENLSDRCLSAADSITIVALGL